MVVLIAPIGTDTEHVTEWLRSGPVSYNELIKSSIYLLHSKKTAVVDFPKKARELVRRKTALDISALPGKVSRAKATRFNPR